MTCIDLSNGPARSACAPRGMVLADELMAAWLASVAACADPIAIPRTNHDATWPFEPESEDHFVEPLAAAAV